MGGAISQLFYGGFYFVVGSWLQVRHFENLNNKIQNAFLMLAGLICGINMGIYWVYGASLWNNNMHEMLVALSSCYVIWYIWANVWIKKDLMGSSFLELCGKKSLQIYLLHLYFVGPLRTIFYKLGIENLPFLILFATIAATIGPLCIGAICEKNRYLKYVFRPADAIRKLV